jgi:hypothetical protein
VPIPVGYLCVNYRYFLSSCSRPVRILFACLKNRFPIFNIPVHGHVTFDQPQSDPDFVVSYHAALTLYGVGNIN